MSAVRFQVLGVPVEIRASFLMLAVILGLPRHMDALMLAWIPLATIAVLVHEAGHAIAFRSFGIPPRIVLHGGGGMTLGSDPGVHRRIIVYGAGPVAGLLLGVVVFLLARALPPGPTTTAMLADVLFATLVWSLLNLLPVGEFDGHAVLKDIVRIAFGHPAGLEIRLIGVGLIVALVIGAGLAGAYDAAVMVALLAIMSSTSFDRWSGLSSKSVRASVGSLLMQGRADEALANADAALGRRPDDRDAMLERATALRILTRYAEAEAAYTAVLELEPGLAGALAGRAMARASVGDDAGARRDLDTLVREPMAGEDASALLVIALYVCQRYGDAADAITTALARPDLERTRRDQLLGLEPIVSEALGRPEEALRQVDAALAGRPDELGLHEARALALVALGRAPEAITSARRALGAAPRNPELLETMGIAERFAGREDLALPRLLAAAAARPESPRGRAELSACFVQAGRLDEARAALESVAERARGNPHVMYAEACLLAASGDQQGASELLTGAARIRPGLHRRASADPLLSRFVDPTRAALGPDHAAA